MADDKVTIVRRLFAAWEAKDDEAGRALLHSDIEWHPAQDEPEQGPMRGIAEVERLLDQWAESFDEFRLEPRDFTASGDCVVVPLRALGRLRGSDSEVAIEETHVYRVRDRRVAEVWCLRTTEEALAVVGAAEGRE
jgi:ketosteroid isomerase-like protein